MVKVNDVGRAVLRYIKCHERGVGSVEKEPFTKYFRSLGTDGQAAMTS